MELRYSGASSDALRASGGSGVAIKVAHLIDHRAMLAQVRRGAVPEPEWREALRGICEDARADDVAPENLLVELKQALRILCDTCSVPHGPARTEFTSRVVTLCIEEYYSADGGEHDGVHPSGSDRQ
jgi:hypothetical protein